MSVMHGKQQEPAQVWIGKTVNELCEVYPPNPKCGVDVFSREEHDNGAFVYEYRFERLVDSKWQEISDPRIAVAEDN